MNWIIESLRIFGASIRAIFSYARGLYWISYLKSPTITIFGGRNADQESTFAKQAHEVAYLCVERGFAVLTGGGPGMMQASNCGAFQASESMKYKPMRTFGIGVRGVDVGFVNVCAPVLQVDSFFTRKWLLTHYSSAFIVFPGGIGTADEFFNVLNLMKVGKIKMRPVILFGSAYWAPLVAWIEQSAIEQGFIFAKYRALFHIIDDPLGAIRIIELSLGK